MATKLASDVGMCVYICLCKSIARRCSLCQSCEQSKIYKIMFVCVCSCKIDLVADKRCNCAAKCHLSNSPQVQKHYVVVAVFILVEKLKAVDNFSFRL